MQLEERRSKAKNNNEVARRPQCDADLRSQVPLQAAEQTNIKKMLSAAYHLAYADIKPPCAGSSLHDVSPPVTCATVSQSQDPSVPIDEVDKIDRFFKMVELQSDAALLSDSLECVGLPILSGAVPGFGIDLIADDPVFRRTGSMKP